MSFLAKPYLKAAFKKILQPLINILVRENVSYTEFISLTQEVFIDTAARESFGPDISKSISRISLLTGINKSVVRSYVYDVDASNKSAPVLTRALAEVMHRWNTDSKFTGPYGGVARELEFDGESEVTFVSLTHATGIDISPTVLLEELLASGMVERVEMDDGRFRYRIVARTFVFQNAGSLTPAMSDHLATVLNDLGATVVNNFQPNVEQKRLERAVYSTEGLTEEQLEIFMQTARHAVSDLITKLDDLLGDMAKAEGSTKSADRVDVGVNFFQFIRSREAEKSLRSLILDTP